MSAGSRPHPDARIQLIMEQDAYDIRMARWANQEKWIAGNNTWDANRNPTRRRSTFNHKPSMRKLNMAKENVKKLELMEAGTSADRYGNTGSGPTGRFGSTRTATRVGAQKADAKRRNRL